MHVLVVLHKKILPKLRQQQKRKEERENIHSHTKNITPGRPQTSE
jgi:hypothetical protein